MEGAELSSSPRRADGPLVDTRADPIVEDQSDSALIERCLSGDEPAWECLIRRYAGLIHGVASRYCLEEERADVFQAVCIELWRNLEKIKDRQRLAAWLVTVTSRLAWQALRQRRAWQNTTTGDEPLEFHVDEDRSPEEWLVAQERWETLRQAVETLRPRCRDLIRWLFFDPEEPSYETIAQRLSMPKDSVGPTRMRCLRSLRHALEDLLPSIP